MPSTVIAPGVDVEDATKDVVVLDEDASLLLNEVLSITFQLLAVKLILDSQSKLAIIFCFYFI